MPSKCGEGKTLERVKALERLTEISYRNKHNEQGGSTVPALDFLSKKKPLFCFAQPCTDQTPKQLRIPTAGEVLTALQGPFGELTPPGFLSIEINVMYV
jgi:hypothetical protein